MKAFRVCLGLAYVVLAALIAAGPAAGYHFSQPKFRWGGKTITYYNKVRAHDAAIRAAIARWNRSGIHIHFKRVRSARAARLVIRSSGSSCGFGATYPVLVRKNRRWRARAALVEIGTKPLLDANTPRECRYLTTLAMAHELGHVIGLGHENRRCALMNSLLDSLEETGPNDPLGAVPRKCPHPSPGHWFCRVLTRDDLRGARKLYGGRFRVRPKANCPIPGAAS